MINPNEVTQPYASRQWKEEFLLFCACVAGKGAAQQAKKLEQFLDLMTTSVLNDDNPTLPKGDLSSPLYLLRSSDVYTIEENLRKVKMGQYTRLTEAFRKLALLDVDTCTLEDLEAIPGIGPKTARFFVVHTRPNQRFMVLDTHILKELRSMGLNVPSSTPAHKKYKEIEEKGLELVALSGMSYAEWDLATWRKYRIK